MNADGSFDSTFDVGTGPNSSVLTLALQADGKPIFAGQFSAYNGATNRYLLARANSDGSIDANYNTSIGPNFPPSAIVVHPNGKVFMGGAFSTMQGVARPYLVRMQDAAVDITFQADFTVGAVNSAALTLAGDLLVATGPTVQRLFADKIGLNVARPIDQTINAGQTLTLTAYAAGTSAISYQWLKNGTNIAGANGATYTIPNAQITDSGYYSVLVSNASGSKTSEAALISVLGAPFIFTQPAGAIGYELGNATFSVFGIGSAPLALQWQVNGVNITNATNATLTLTNLQFSNAANYAVVFSNSSGVLTSSVAALTVLAGAGQVDPASLLGSGPGSGSIAAIVRQSTDKLVLGGYFTTFNGLSKPYTVRLNVDGTLDTNFTSGASQYSVVAIAALPDEKILARTTANTLVRLNTNGTADNTFSNVTFTMAGSGSLLGPVVLSDGKFLMAGGIWTINGQTLPISGKIVRFNANGTLDAILNGAIDFFGNALAFTAREDGKIFLSGVFNTVSGVGRTNFAVFNSDGSLDTTFIRGNGFNSGNIPYVLTFQPDGKLLVGGTFTNYNGVSRINVARLNSDGSLDATFNPGTGPNQAVTSITVQDDGKLLLVGGFTSVAGQPRPGMARLNADGSLDNTFYPGTGLNTGSISALALQYNGRITLAGSFTQWNGTNKNGLVQLRGTPVNLAITRQPLTQYADAGSSVTLSVGVYTTSAESYQWRKNGTNIPGATSATLTLNNLQTSDSGAYSVAVANVATNKTSLSGLLTVLTVPLVLSQEGSVTASTGSTNTLKATVVGAGALSYQWQRNGTNIAGATNVTLTLTNTALADAGVYVLVVTNAYGAAESQPLALSVSYSPGRPDASFAYGTGFNQAINSMAAQPDGKLLVSGYFSNYNGTTVPYFVRLNTDGTLDSSFNVTAGVPINFGSPGPIQGIYPLSNGTIYVFGTFTNLGGSARTNLARFDTNGTLDTSFVPAATQLGSVQTLAVQSDGRILIGGNFTTVGGVSKAYAARLLSSGALDTSFTINPVLNNAVSRILVQPDDKPLLIGGFTVFQSPSTWYFVARFQTNGALDNTFTNAAGSWGFTAPYCGALQPDGKLLVGGSFSSVSNFSRSGFARLNANGTVDLAFTTNGVGASGSSGVSSITPLPDGKAIIQGNFTTINGVARPGLARVKSDGSLDVGYDPGAGPIFNNSPNNSVVSCIATLPDGRVALGGYLNFTNFSGTTVGKFVVLANDGANPLVVVAQSQSDTVSPGTAVNFAVAATGIGPLTYQWYSGAAGNISNPVAGATNNTLSVVVGSAVFNYWVRVTNGAGQVSDSQNVTVGPETLLFTRQPGGFQLNWTGSYILQVNTNLSLLNWTDVPGVSPVTVPFDSRTNRLFFRLRQGP